MQSAAMIRDDGKSEPLQLNEEVMRWEDVSDVMPKMSFPSTWKGQELGGLMRRKHDCLQDQLSQSSAA